MKGLTHLSFGLATGLATASVLSGVLAETEQIAFVSGATLGAILVDIDSEKTIIGNNLKPFSTIIQKTFGHRMLVHSPLFLICFYALFSSILYYGQPFHNIIGNILGIIALILIITLFISNFNKYGLFNILKSFVLYLGFPLVILEQCYHSPELVLNGIVFGWIGHLFLDMMTVGGIPLFYPIKFKSKKTDKKYVKKFKFFFFKSCAWYECFIAMILFVLFFVGLIAYYEYAQQLSCYNPFIVLKEYIFMKFGW